jgi:hypothetical protein
MLGPCCHKLFHYYIILFVLYFRPNLFYSINPSSINFLKFNDRVYLDLLSSKLVHIVPKLLHIFFLSCILIKSFMVMINIRNICNWFKRKHKFFMYINSLTFLFRYNHMLVDSEHRSMIS